MSDLITRRFLHSVVRVHTQCEECGHEQDVLVAVTVGVEILAESVRCAHCEGPIYSLDETGNVPSEIVEFVDEDGVTKRGRAYFHPACKSRYHDGLKLSGKVYPMECHDVQAEEN